jgi:hypothetical protein
MIKKTEVRTNVEEQIWDKFKFHSKKEYGVGVREALEKVIINYVSEKENYDH